MESTYPITTFSNLEKKRKLGQVFTPSPLADFMIGIFKDKLTSKHAILDPCIGPNTFFSKLQNLKITPELVGIEVDQELITPEIEEFYSGENRTLLFQNFLDFSTDNKFDFIIQNPPYVRQELLFEGENTKSIAGIGIGKVADKIPAQSNLYVYFIIKSILHLKNNGVLVAVIYDSWLYSSFGEALKKLLVQLGNLENIYHFRNRVFEDADVGATVIEFSKRKSTEFDRINYYVADSYDEFLKGRKFILPFQIHPKKFSEVMFNRPCAIDFNSTFFLPIKSISNSVIRRGTSSIANGYFLHDHKRFIESVPIIKDVSKIKTFVATKETSYLLYVNNNVSKELQEYLDTVKLDIIAAGSKYKSVAQKIEKGASWFNISLKKPGNFIFNYYLRNNIDFILNENQFYASDNFYILDIAQQINAHLAIFNSSFSKLAILHRSRNQGNGLRKIQLYEFNEVLIIDVNALASDTIYKLDLLGQELRNISRYNDDKHIIISRIDAVLLSDYNKFNNSNLSIHDLHNELIKHFT